MDGSGGGGDGDARPAHPAARGGLMETLVVQTVSSPPFSYRGPSFPAEAVPVPEHRVLLACAHALLGGEVPADPALIERVDPTRLRDLAGAHGLLPLLGRFLARFGAAGAPLRAALRAEALAGSREALALTAELLSVVRGMEGEGVPVVAYKGPALAVQAFGDPSLRRYADLDLVVPRAALEGAVAALQRLGFAQEPFASARQRAAVLRDGHHLALHRGGVVVELHWRFSKRVFGFREELEGVWERRETVPVAGAAVPVLARGDHLLALAIHASKGTWSALEWTLAMAVLARGVPAGEWEALARRARAWGCVRALQVSFLLAEELFATPAPAALWAHLPPGAAARRVARRVARQALAGAQSPAAYFGTQVALRAGMPAKLRFLLRSLFVPTPDDWAASGGTRRGLGLARLARPLRLLRKYGVERGG